MTRVLLCMFVIFLMGGSAKAQIAISIELVTSIIEWTVKIYNVIEKYKNPDKSRQNIEVIMAQVAEASSKLDALETDMDVNLDGLLNLLLSDIRIETTLQNTKMQLRHHLNKVDHYFDQSRTYNFHGKFGNETLQAFSHKLLWGGDALPDLLDQIHDLFFSNSMGDTGLLSLMRHSAMLDIQHECNTYVSTQQQVYYIYIHLIISEAKGLIVLQQCYLIERMFDATGYNYMSELNNIKTRFANHLKDYHELFDQKIDLFPRHIRRCEGKPPLRGVTFIELQKFSRIAILNKHFVINGDCVNCPTKFQLNAISLQTNTTITDCIDMGQTITACPAGLGSPHQYSWLQDAYNQYYGPNTTCDVIQSISGGTIMINQYKGIPRDLNCRVCACSMEPINAQKTDASTFSRISTTDQMSDLRNNKVVTGAKFVIQDNALHLQIQETLFSYNGMIYNNSKWKELDIGFYDAGVTQVKRPMTYAPLQHNRRSLYLDDIRVPTGCAMTGVRFQLAGDSAFKLQIYVSKFDLGTGKLFPFGGDWIDASTHPMKSDDYKRKRIEIDMGESDDPTRSSEFTYDLASNKLIKFTHTGFRKDAGQTTIPLLDAQPAQSLPSFPLDGIGLSFMGRKGFGGYISPRLYTMNVKNYIKDLTTHMDIPSTISQITSRPRTMESKVPTARGKIYSHSSARQSGTLNQI